MNQKQPSQILFITAGTLTILGAFFKLFDIKFAPYVFSLGAALLIYLQGKSIFDKKKKDSNQRRFARTGLITSLMLGVGAYFMFTGSNSWVVMVLIYALSSFYLSFRSSK
jgi:hypothetical protein